MRTGAGEPFIHSYRGFTLVEMVFTIVIAGIILVLAAALIVRPVEGYRDLSRRAMLVNNAESALRQMAREVRNALPNSVRIRNITGGGYALEMLPVIDGAMYRTRAGDGTNDVQQLKFGNNDDNEFDIHKFFQNIPVPPSGSYVSTTHRLVIGNKGTTNFDAYVPATVIDPDETTGVITPLNTSVTNGFVIKYVAGGGGGGGSAGATHIKFTNSADVNVFHRFTNPSTRQRLYVIETPVTYLCAPNDINPSLGTLTRYANYPIQSTQPTTAAVLNGLSGVTSALVSSQISACTVRSDFSMVRKYGIVVLDLTLSEATGGTVRLLHQVLVENSQ